jgi:hypothetical protein
LTPPEIPVFVAPVWRLAAMFNIEIVFIIGIESDTSKSSRNPAKTKNGTRNPTPSIVVR